MSGVGKIKAVIKALPIKDYAKLRKWFSENDWQKWDEEIEEDSKSGKLDFLINEALKEKKNGRLREL